MGKMMSLLEKYKIVEKETPDETENVQAPSSEAVTEINNEPVLEDSTNEIATAIEKGEEPMTSDNKEQTSFSNVKGEQEMPSQPSAELYHQKQSIDAIYEYAGLNGKTVTDTAFFLENLIHALPNELPEYVKKTTVDNIINASNIDINKLLSDGMDRFRQLDQFQQTFSDTNSTEIAALKQEIDRLSAAITNYHQMIKQKELLVQEEAELVEAEKDRINHILTFFKAE